MGQDVLVYEDERLTFTETHTSLPALPVCSSMTSASPRVTGWRSRCATSGEWSVAFWGATAAGAVVVPLKAWWTGPELEYGLADSGASVVVADAERARRIGDHLGALPGARGPCRQ